MLNMEHMHTTIAGCVLFVTASFVVLLLSVQILIDTSMIVLNSSRVVLNFSLCYVENPNVLSPAIVMHCSADRR